MADVKTGRPVTLAGLSHSWLLPTRRSAPPAAHTTSVAEGSRDTTRQGSILAAAQGPSAFGVSM